MFKILVVFLLLVIVSSLFSGMYYMVKDKGKTDRAVKALTWRIGISVALFALLLIGSQTGLIQPHGVTPTQHTP
ncbi:MAG: twin transmembrane helix small protein [Gammaproteobacteria bacterium]|nr:twin transmembrane helix small protein [Gammaproteobacteria bacterium]